MVCNFLKLPSVEFSQRETLPSTFGVYYISDDNGVLVYVGRSVNLQQRLLAHEKLPVFFSLISKGLKLKIYYLETIDYVGVEAESIRKFKPLMNKEIKVKANSKWAFDEQRSRLLKLIKENERFRRALYDGAANKDGGEHQAQPDWLVSFVELSRAINPDLWGIVEHCEESSLFFARVLDGFCLFIEKECLPVYVFSTGVLMAISKSLDRLQTTINGVLKTRLR